jgi:hypothetical protein
MIYAFCPMSKYNTNPVNKDFSTYTIALSHFVLQF